MGDKNAAALKDPESTVGIRVRVDKNGRRRRTTGDDAKQQEFMRILTAPMSEESEWSVDEDVEHVPHVTVAARTHDEKRRARLMSSVSVAGTATAPKPAKKEPRFEHEYGEYAGGEEDGGAEGSVE